MDACAEESLLQEGDECIILFLGGKEHCRILAASHSKTSHFFTVEVICIVTPTSQTKLPGTKYSLARNIPCSTRWDDTWHALAVEEHHQEVCFQQRALRVEAKNPPYA